MDVTSPACFMDLNKSEFDEKVHCMTIVQLLSHVWFGPLTGHDLTLSAICLAIVIISFDQGMECQT